MEKFFNLLNENTEFYDNSFFEYIENLSTWEKEKLSTTILNYIHLMNCVKYNQSKNLQEFTEKVIQKILAHETGSLTKEIQAIFKDFHTDESHLA